MRRVIRRSAWLGLLFSLATSSPLVRAEDEPAPRDHQHAAAEALFAAGRAAAKRGETRAACAKFRESHRLDPALGTRLNLALCEAELGRLAPAWQLFRSLLTSLAPSDPRLPLVRERLGQLEARVPWLSLEAAGELPPELSVKTGALEITRSGFGVPIPLDPGAHTFEVSAPGFEPRRYDVTLREGESRVLSIERLVRRRTRVAVAPSRASSAAEPRDTLQRELGIVALGVGASAVAVSLASGLAALEKKETMSAECDPRCSRAGLSAAADGEKLTHVATAAFFTGLALTGAGTSLLFIRDGGTPRAAAGPALRIHPGGLSFRARF